MSIDGPLGAFEEQVLLAMARVGSEAYGMSVRRELESAAARTVSIGAVYATLDRLVAKGLAESFSGKVTGRGRRFYRMTRAGAEALVATRALRERLWDGVPAVLRERLAQE